MAGDGEIVDHLSVPTVRGPAGVLDSARAAVDLDGGRMRTTRAAARVTAIGVGVPGIVDSAMGIVDNAVNLGLDSMRGRTRCGPRAVTAERTGRG